MGLFSSSSKASASTTNTSAGAQTQYGDPVSVNITQTTGKKSKGGDITVVSTDYGAVQAGIASARDSAIAASQAARASVDSVESISSKSLDVNAWLLDSFSDRAASFASSLVSAGQQSADRSAGAVGELATGFQEFIRAENSPNERNQMILIGGVAVVLIVMLTRRGR